MSAQPIRYKIQSLVYRVLGYRLLRTDTNILLLAVLVGVLGGYGAIGFRLLIDLAQSLALGVKGDHILGAIGALPWYWKLGIPMIGGAIVAPMVYFFAREAKGHGVPEVMEAIALRGGKIRPRVVLVKSLASAISIGTGGSVGREGPIVQIGSAIGSTLGQWFGVSQERLRLLVACGGAAGIAATFNAPIAGVLFSVEILLGNYAISTLSPLIISSVLATIISRMHIGNIPAFEIPQYSMASSVEIVFFAGLGLLAGVVGVGFIRILYAIEDFFDSLRFPDYAKGVVGGAIIGAALFYFPHIYGVGYQTITEILTGKGTWQLLVALVVVKIFATSITIGSGGSGGIFAPSLLMGAALGGAFGTGIGSFFPGITAPSGAYAVAGMGALVAATTRAPITAIIMIFEMTGDYKVILPIMTACILGSLIASKLSKESIYTLKLARRGVQLNEGLDISIMRGTKIGDLLRAEVSVFLASAPFSKVLKRTLASQQLLHYVVDSQHRLRGVISFHDVKSVMNNVELEGVIVADDMAERHPPTVRASAPVSEALDILLSHKANELPVMDDEGVFLGVISEQAILDLYNREVLRSGTQGLKFIQRNGKNLDLDYVQMDEGSAVEIVEVTPSLHGKTLAELSLRHRYGVNVVSIRSPRTSRYTTAPDPEQPLQQDEILVVTGSPERIQQLRDEWKATKKTPSSTSSSSNEER